MYVYVPPGQMIDYDKLESIPARILCMMTRKVPMVPDPDYRAKPIARSEGSSMDRMVWV